MVAPNTIENAVPGQSSGGGAQGPQGPGSGGGGSQGPQGPSAGGQGLQGPQGPASGGGGSQGFQGPQGPDAVASPLDIFRYSMIHQVGG